MTWRIFDRGQRGRRARPLAYIAIDFATPEDAAGELAVLLAPYPPRCEWRRRLVVLPADGAPLPNDAQRLAGKAAAATRARRRAEIRS